MLMHDVPQLSVREGLSLDWSDRSWTSPKAARFSYDNHADPGLSQRVPEWSAMNRDNEWRDELASSALDGTTLQCHAP
jgi:hypothetical protein